MSSSDLGDLHNERLLTDPFSYTSGPRDSPVLLVGEAWGADEERARKPFVGHSGKELDRILFDAGLSRSQILCTNLVDARPPSNDFTAFLLPQDRSAKASLFRGLRPSQPLVQGHHKLLELIRAVQPRLIIGAGNWPLWALTPHAKLSTQKGYKLPSGITSWRGSQTYTEPIYGRSYPYLPIIHPAAILRSWSLRYPTCQDLRARAAGHILRGKPWDAPERGQILSKPSFEQVRDHLRGWQTRLDAGQELLLCIDLETWKRRFICVIGISDSSCSLCIPFFYFDEAGQLIDYFSADQEAWIHEALRQLLSHPKLRITNQNYFYDFQFLHRFLHIKTAPSFDTMLAHHLLFPGTPKDLAYLASLYCSHYCYWKDESQDWDAKSNHEQLWLYNCKDTSYTYEITQVLQATLEKQKMLDLYQSQLDQWQLAADLYLTGVRWNWQRARKMRAELRAKATELQAFMLSCMPDDIRYAPSGIPWFDSPRHQQLIFYDLLGVPPILHKKTKKPTLDKESFEQLKKKAPWLGFLFDQLKLYRSIEVFENNFLSAITGPDNRMHSSFNIGGTETFRWSSSQNAFGEGLNLQNLPAERD